MLDNFKDVAETLRNRFAESPLGKQLEGMDFDNIDNGFLAVVGGSNLKAQKSAQNAFKFGTEKNRGSRITAAKLRLPAKGGLTQFGGAAGPQARAAWTLLFPQP